MSRNLSVRVRRELAPEHVVYVHYAVSGERSLDFVRRTAASARDDRVLWRVCWANHPRRVEPPPSPEGSRALLETSA